MAEYAAARAFAWVLGMMPLGMVYALVDVLAWLAFSVIGVRRGITLDNLRMALGNEYDEHEIVRIARRSYTEIGMTFIEMFILDRLRGRIHDIVDGSELDNVRQALKQGRGVILTAAHFGSWELNGTSIGMAEGIPIATVARTQSNPYVDRWIKRTRESAGVDVYPPGVSIKHLVRALRNGYAVGLISDQDAGRRGVFVPFFGIPASTPQGAAQLTLRYGSPMLITQSVRIAPGKYRSIYREVPVEPDDTVETLTARYTRMIEDVVREHPEQYFWMHRRWKTRPPGETQTVARGNKPGNDEQVRA